MKIIYALNGLGICGGVRIIFEHCNRLAARGHEVSIAVTSGLCEQDWFPLSPAVKIVGWHAADFDVDVLVATEWSTAPLVIKTQAKRKYYFVQMRESLFSFHAGWKKDAEETYKLPLKIITISRWLKDFLEEEYHHKDILVIPNGVNREMFFPEPKYPCNKVMRVLIEGHEANAAKNVRDAFAALDRVGAPHEIWGFNQVGPGSHKYNKFFFQPSQEEIRRLYSSSDILLKTSRYEGRSCVPVEAMACGCAVIATECHGTDDLIDDYNCLLLPYGDIVGLALSTEMLLRDEDRRQLLISNGLNYVRHHLDWDKIIDQLEIRYGVY